jgi:tetratricopeptide (TPR) repeat protein
MSKRGFKYYLAGACSLTTFFVYLSSLNNSFVLWDDEYYVFDNPHIRSFDLAFLKWAFLDFYQANWHPLTWISHALDYAVWGLNPVGHHLTNNLLHAVNTFLVVLLVVRLVESTSPESPVSGPRSQFKIRNSRFTLVTAGVTGLFFGLHPLHVESVAWVAERKDLLCGLFFLLSVMMYTLYLTPPIPPAVGSSVKRGWQNRGLYLLSLSFFILALSSKPMAVSLPLVLLVLDWYPLNRIQSIKSFWSAFTGKIPFIALSLISSVLTVLAQRKAIQSLETVELSSRVLVATKSLTAYLGKMVLPINLIPYYAYPDDASLFSPEYISVIVLAFAITAVCIVMAKKQKLFLATWSYYVITLIPVLGLVKVGGQAMADRYTYLPSLGPFLLTGLLIAWGAEWVSLRKRGLINVNFFLATATIIAVLSLSALTHRQIGVWKNSVALWTYVIEKERIAIPIAYNNRGLAFFAIDQTDKAIEDYHQTIALSPSYAEAHSNLGIALMKKGLVSEAIGEFRTSIRLLPEFVDARRILASALFKSGRIEEALQEYLSVAKLRPDDAGAHADLGSAHGAMGSYDKAIEHFQIALRLRPEYADVHYNLGIVYQAKGLMDQAVSHLEAAARLNPTDAAIRDDLARAHSLKTPVSPLGSPIKGRPVRQIEKQ